MDRGTVQETIEALVRLYEGGYLPKANFSLGQVEGLLAAKLGVDVTKNQLIAAFGALGVERASDRAWNRYSCWTALRSAARPNTAGAGKDEQIPVIS